MRGVRTIRRRGEEIRETKQQFEKLLSVLSLWDAITIPLSMSDAETHGLLYAQSCYTIVRGIEAEVEKYVPGARKQGTSEFRWGLWKKTKWAHYFSAKLEYSYGHSGVWWNALATDANVPIATSVPRVSSRKVYIQLHTHVHKLTF